MAVPGKKRTRAQTFQAFGQQLVTWRGELDVETVVRFAENMGVQIAAETLRNYEYGWVGAPDPVKLAALAAIYKIPFGTMLSALIEARRLAGQDIKLVVPSTDVTVTAEGSAHGKQTPRAASRAHGNLRTQEKAFQERQRAFQRRLEEFAAQAVELARRFAGEHPSVDGAQRPRQSATPRKGREEDLA